MFRKFVILAITVLFINFAQGDGEFSVLHHPSSLSFRGHDILRESSLHDVYAAALSFSTEHYSDWQGMFIENPFELPEAIVTIAVDGVRNINQPKGHHFPLTTDTSESEVFDALQRSILAHSPDQSPNLVKIDLSNGLEDINKYDLFEGIQLENNVDVSLKVLKLDNDEDREFLKEINILQGIANGVEHSNIKKDNVPDVYWFSVKSLHPLSDLYGANSTATIEAQLLLNEAILKINNSFAKLYEGGVLVNIITSDVSHTRRTRRNILAAEVKADDATTDKQKYNLASYYDQDYPVIFNIILWFGIIMLFSMIAICLAIGNMDPGRDSIIYRMTSTRMKKDN